MDAQHGARRLTLAKLKASPAGVDLGALAPRISEVLRTPSGKNTAGTNPHKLCEHVSKTGSVASYKGAQKIERAGSSRGGQQHRDLEEGQDRR